MAAQRQIIVLAANTAWNISNYRRGLIGALNHAGFEPVVVAPNDKSVALASLGVRHMPVTIDRAGTNPVRDVRLAATYLYVLRHLRPAALLSFTAKPNIYGCVAARILRIPAFPNISGLGTVFAGRGRLKRLMIFMYRRSLGSARAVFFQNEEDRDEFIRMKIIRPDQARRLPGSGVDLEWFGQAELPAGPVSFLLISRLLHDKGVAEFVEAARLLRRLGVDAVYRLLGPLDPENPSAINPAELSAWVDEGIVEYLGQTDDVRSHIAAASVVVLPSSYREGVPRALLEGAAMGRPLIASDVPGCRDAVQDGVNGFLCEARDVVSLATAMRRLAESPADELRTMGAASRALAEAHFDEKIVIQAYLDELARLGLHARGRRGLD